jgi:glycosyltransferase involved in cell wall biosynthesis
MKGILMTRPVTACVPYSGSEDTQTTVEQLKRSGVVEEVVLLAPGTDVAPIEGCKLLTLTSLESSTAVRAIARAVHTPYTLVLLHDRRIELGQFGLERFLTIAEVTGAGLVYSDFYDIREGIRAPHPVIEYQPGSIRDDFDFGSLLFIRTHELQRAARGLNALKYGALYALRLALSRHRPIVRIGEFLYSRSERDTRKSGEKQFDYVDPKNRQVQTEMEQVATEHLKKIGAYLKPKFEKVNLDERQFETEASVIIPVRNRVRTIADAVASVLQQRASFAFNLFVVDNHSTDGTTEVIRTFAEKENRIIHLVPGREDLGIGGCWNEAVHHPRCGRFAVQLDSDDLYKDETTLQRIVDTFRRERCAMVVGTYQMTDFGLKEIPPGVIDHREWTPDNGRNNALRINGLGAPRAFYTPILRRIKVPNVSYGEDYAVGLAISREYKIGRIYEPIYLCRRWEGNSDADIDVQKLNTFNFYKDKIRTFEIFARQKKNRSSLPARGLSARKTTAPVIRKGRRTKK